MAAGIPGSAGDPVAAATQGPDPTAPSAEPSLRDVIMASAAQQAPDASSPSLPPDALSGQADSGAGNVLPADAPLPPPNPQSPFGGPPQAMTPPPVTPPSAMSNAMAGGQPPVSAAPLSTDRAPGFDSFGADGSVQGSSLGAAGFTGRDNASDPVTAATQGGLPAPQSYVGGDLGLGTPSSAPPPATAAAPSAPPAGPPPNMTSPLAAALSKPSPPGAQTLANAGPNPDAPASGASNAGPAPLTSPLAQALMSQPQPMGLAGHSAAADPSSPQNFQRQQMLASMLAGGSSAGSAQPGAPSKPVNTPSATPAAPQGGGLLSGLFGGGQQPASAGLALSGRIDRRSLRRGASRPDDDAGRD